jgi:hypothetical protein
MAWRRMPRHGQPRQSRWLQGRGWITTRKFKEVAMEILQIIPFNHPGGMQSYCCDGVQKWENDIVALALVEDDGEKKIKPVEMDIIGFNVVNEEDCHLGYAQPDSWSLFESEVSRIRKEYAEKKAAKTCADSTPQH